jgi:hypothetical protein
MALTVASFGAFLSIPAHAGLVSTKWTFAKPVGLFAVRFVRFLFVCDLGSNPNRISQQFMLIVATGILVYTRILVSRKRRFQYI